MTTPARYAALALALVLVASSGCAAKGEVNVQVMVSNETQASVPLILKVWDHNGELVFNRTTEAAHVLGQQSMGIFTGPVSNYGGKYSFLARAGDIEEQVDANAEGIGTWTVVIHDDRVEFKFE